MLSTLPDGCVPMHRRSRLPRIPSAPHLTPPLCCWVWVLGWLSCLLVLSSLQFVQAGAPRAGLHVPSDSPGVSGLVGGASHPTLGEASGLLAPSFPVLFIGTKRG